MSIDSSSIFYRNFKIYISVIIYIETATILVQPQLSSSNSLGVMIKWRVVVVSKLWNRVKSSNSINSLCITEQKLFWAGKDSFLGKIYFLSNTSLWAASKLTKNCNKPTLKNFRWLLQKWNFSVFLHIKRLKERFSTDNGIVDVIPVKLWWQNRFTI